MMQRLTDLYSDTYYRFKRAIFLSVGAVLLGVLVFAYLSNVQIDGGTEHTYQTLDVLFYVFCGLLPVAAASDFMFMSTAQDANSGFSVFPRASSIPACAPLT